METMQNMQNWMYGVRDYIYSMKDTVSNFLLSLPPEQVAMLSIGAAVILILMTKIIGIVIDAFQEPSEIKKVKRKKKRHKNIQLAKGDHTTEHAQAMWDEINKI